MIDSGPVILSRGSDNKTLRYWHYEVENERWRGHYGVVGGKDATSKWSTAKPTNLGKANERDAIAQAAFEARAEHKHKLDRDYRETEEALVDVPAAVMLAQEYDKLKSPLKFNPGLAIQPKLDGIRLVGERGGGYSRSFQPFGDPINHIRAALAPVFARYPDIILDGELYNHTLHADFNALSSVIRKKKCKPEELREAQRVIEYHIYDCPSHPGGFDERHNRLLDLFAEFDFSLEPIVHVPTYFPHDLEQLDVAYSDWMMEGYEGQMVRLPGDPYEFGVRSWNLLKRKNHVTEEFEVTRVIAGTGNWAGLAKAIEFKMPSGALTEQGELPKCGMRGDEAFARKLLHQDPPPKIVTVRHLGLTPGGVPRGPVAIDFDRED